MWPFTRKPKPPVCSERWAPGDAAECIDSDMESFMVNKGCPIRVGDRFLVTECHLYGGFLYLGLAGYSDSWFDALCFRKIVLADTGADRRVGESALLTKEKAVTLEPRKRRVTSGWGSQ